MKILTFTIIAIALVYNVKAQNQKIEVAGDLMKWHKVELIIDGPQTSELAVEYPFLDYKLDVTFTNGNKSYTVPGFYAADGNAAETSAGKGNIWKVRFRPDETGTWNYNVSFRKGEDIVVKDGGNLGEPTKWDGLQGSFKIGESDKKGADFRAKGRIVNGGDGYFEFQKSKEVWIKNGADSPENFLAYADFDQTSRFSLNTEVREGEADPKESLHK
ncbi:MAG TPA: DUF5060 domain-containing protein, partial [Prolixibacteraceae bacterium]|nr:DUF5060 domain-containing protein [Prolixibacteraceae bacterium]